MLPVDMSDEQATLKRINQTHARWGRLDILINSAGVADVASVETADVSSWRRMFEVNTLGLIIASKAAILLVMTCTS